MFSRTGGKHLLPQLVHHRRQSIAKLPDLLQADASVNSGQFSALGHIDTFPFLSSKAKNNGNTVVESRELEGDCLSLPLLALIKPLGFVGEQAFTVMSAFRNL